MEQQEILEVLQCTNLKKKYIRLAELVHAVEGHWLVEQQKTIIYDLFNGCFDDNLSSSSSKLLSKVLTKLYTEISLTVEGDIQIASQWTQLWIQQYCDALRVNQQYFHLNTSPCINQTISDIKMSIIPIILKNIQERDPDFTQKHLVWGFCSLLRIAKVNGFIVIDSEKQQLTSKIGVTIEIKMSILQSWLFNQDKAIQQEILQAIVDNNKLTDPPTQFELEMTLQFIQFGLRTSHPNYRREYLVRLKWFFERVRKCYEKDFILLEKGKAPRKNLDMLESYLNRMLVSLYGQLFPDVAFELANPVLDIIKMIYTYFGACGGEIEIKKGVFLKQVSFLKRLECQPYSEILFECLLTQMSSCWESARILAYEIIQLFPQDAPYLTCDKLQQLYEQGLQLIGDPVIRRFENGGYLLSWLMLQHSQRLYPNEKDAQLYFLSSLMNQLRSRYLVFREVFSSDIDALQKNLIHGYICTFWIILQRNKIELLQQLGAFMEQLLDLLRDIIEFATQLSADNTTTQIFGDQSTKKDQSDPNLQVDCRGHFYFKDPLIKNVGVLLQGNTLIVEGESGDNLPENILVVSFYLVTREAGYFFFQLAGLLERHERLQKQCTEQQFLVPTECLRAIVYQYFHALLNIKHLGSIDRISQGLNQVAKVMGNSKTPQIPHFVLDLLDKMIDAFHQNSTLNIVRRSQGLPHVLACLLKSLTNQQKTIHIPKVVQVMIDFAQGSQLELKVHSLNILKKLFSESQLTDRMDTYIGIAFKISIQSFSFDDWSVRNSALMLFSALSSRTIGRQANSDKLGQRKNFIEFFAMAPELVQFFNEEIDNFLKADSVPIYPSLYPITLLLSRLIPYDMKMHRTVDLEDKKKWTFQPSEIECMLPKLIQCCATNKNYLGRIMVSKSILPFLKFEKIPEWVENLINIFSQASSILERIPDYEFAVRNHNLTHGLLLITKQVMIDYYMIKEETQRLYDAPQLNEMKASELNLLQRLAQCSFLVSRIQCPPIQLTIYEILIIIMQGLREKHTHFEEFEVYAKQLIQESFDQPTFRIKVDMSHSILRKKCLSFLLKWNGIHQEQPSLIYHLGLIEQLLKKYLHNTQLIMEDDLEVFMFLLKQLNLVVKQSPILIEIHVEQLNQIIGQLIALFGTQEASFSHFSLCVYQGLRLILNLSTGGLKIDSLQDIQKLLKPLMVHFSLNSMVLKQIIKVSGVLVQQLHDVDLDLFYDICYKYSQCDNIDDQRIAVIKSFTSCFPQLMALLQKSKSNPKSQKMILSFYSVFLRLLQDEIPEVRQKISKFLCKRGESKKNTTLRLNFEYVLSHFYTQIVQLSEIDYSIKVEYLLTQIFGGEFYSVKRINHFQKKIFSIEKGNKFHNDFKIAEMSYRLILQLTLDEHQRKELSTQLATIKQEFQTFTMEQAQTYQNYFSQRDEYIFENLYQLMIYEGLQRKADPNYQTSEIYRYVIDPTKNFDLNLKQLANDIS